MKNHADRLLYYCRQVQKSSDITRGQRVRQGSDPSDNFFLHRPGNHLSSAAEPHKYWLLRLWFSPFRRLRPQLLHRLQLYKSSRYKKIYLLAVHSNFFSFEKYRYNYKCTETVLNELNIKMMISVQSTGTLPSIDEQFYEDPDPAKKRTRSANCMM